MHYIKIFKKLYSLVRCWRCLCLRIPEQAGSSWDRPKIFQPHQVVHRPQDRPSCLFAHTDPCRAVPFRKVTLRNHYRSYPRQHGLGMVAVQSNTASLLIQIEMKQFVSLATINRSKSQSSPAHVNKSIKWEEMCKCRSTCCSARQRESADT